MAQQSFGLILATILGGLAAILAASFVSHAKEQAQACAYAPDGPARARCSLTFQAYGAAGVETLRTREALN